MKIPSVAWNLSMLERYQDVFWVRVLVKMSYVAQKLGTTEECHQYQNCFGEKMTELKATTLKNV